MYFSENVISLSKKFNVIQRKIAKLSVEMSCKFTLYNFYVFEWEISCNSGLKYEWEFHVYL